MKNVIKINIVNSLGNSFYQNFGLFGVFIIFLSEWMQGRELTNEKAVSVLSVIYFVFFVVNNVFYFGLANCQTYLAILRRLSTVMEMDEFKRYRVTDRPSEETSILLENAAFSWGFKVKEE